MVFAAPRDIRLDVAPGTRVSLYPLLPVTGSSAGLAWPIDGLKLAPGGRIGTSNRATGAVTLAFSGAGMLVVLPREALVPAIDALLASG